MPAGPPRLIVLPPAAPACGPRSSCFLCVSTTRSPRQPAPARPGCRSRTYSWGAGCGVRGSQGEPVGSRGSLEASLEEEPPRGVLRVRAGNGVAAFVLVGLEGGRPNPGRPCVVPTTCKVAVRASRLGVRDQLQSAALTKASHLGAGIFPLRCCSSAHRRVQRWEAGAPGGCSACRDCEVSSTAEFLF